MGPYNCSVKPDSVVKPQTREPCSSAMIPSSVFSHSSALFPPSLSMKRRLAICKQRKITVESWTLGCEEFTRNYFTSRSESTNWHWTELLLFLTTGVTRPKEHASLPLIELISFSVSDLKILFFQCHRCADWLWLPRCHIILHRWAKTCTKWAVLSPKNC